MNASTTDLLLKDITWEGSRYYINAQLLILFVRILSEYKNGERKLTSVFTYIHAMKDQMKVQIYPPLLNELHEMLLLEQCIQVGEVDIEMVEALRFCINSCINVFTRNEKKLGYSDYYKRKKTI